MATLPAVHAMDEAPGIVASPERIDAWLATAHCGDRFIYATRMALPFGSKGAARMRLLQDAGLVQLNVVRSTLDQTVFNYTATRTGKAQAGEKLRKPRLSAKLVDAEVALTNALLPVLTRAARFGRPCPTDAQLAERTKLAVEVIQPGLAALSAAGLIRVESAPSPTRRRITIVATGDRTGLIA